MMQQPGMYATYVARQVGLHRFHGIRQRDDKAARSERFIV